MTRQRQKDTKPELWVRKALHAAGFRYRVRNRDLPGSPDIANRSKRWAIFVHGCYWHRHPGCPRATTPKRNREFWLRKFERNRQRDLEAVEALEEMGFTVLTIWECETGDEESLRELFRAKLGSPHYSSPAQRKSNRFLSS